MSVVGGGQELGRLVAVLQLRRAQGIQPEGLGRGRLGFPFLPLPDLLYSGWSISVFQGCCI